MCGECGVTGDHIAHKTPMAKETALVPRHYPRVRCGSTKDVEWHHWAPQALFFDDAHAWPLDPLCQVVNGHRDEVL